MTTRGDTTIRDISDLIRVLQDYPDWRNAVRGIVIGDDMLALPQQLAKFVQSTEENFRIARERDDQTDRRLAEFIQSTNENFRIARERADQTDRRLAEFIQSTEENFRIARERDDQTDRRLAEFIQSTNENFRIARERADQTDRRLAEFIQSTNENFRIARERADQTDRRIDETNQRLADFIQSTEENFRIARERADQTDRRIDETNQRLADFIQSTEENFRIARERADQTDRRIDETNQRLADFIQSTEENFRIARERADQTDRRIDETNQRLADFIQSTEENFRIARERADQTDRRIDELALDVKGRFQEVNRSIARLEGRVSNLEGGEYERKISKNIDSYITSRMDVRRVRLLKGAFSFDEDMLDMLYDAEDDQKITKDDRRAIGLADIILRAQREDNRSEVYIVGEVSVTLAGGDVARAARRAAILQEAIGVPTLAAVVCNSIDEERMSLAGEMDVAIVMVGNGS